MTLEEEIPDNRLVSVIIIFLNGERFLEEAIESVLAQTYTSWELLLVDDGSTEASTKIAYGYAAKFPEKVCYLEHPGHENRGMSASRNLGIAKSKGEYIAFLDADDVWLPNKLERQTAILMTHPEVAMVYGPGHYWHSWTGNPEDTAKDYMQKIIPQTDRVHQPPFLLSHYLRRSSGPLPSCLIVRRSAVEKTGYFEEDFRAMYEDQAFVAKLCLRSAVFLSSECWLKYRQHEDACYVTAVREGRFRESRLFYLNWLSEYMKRERLTDTEIWPVLQEQFWPYRHPFLNRLRLVFLKKRLRARLSRAVPSSIKKAIKSFWPSETVNFHQ